MNDTITLADTGFGTRAEADLRASLTRLNDAMSLPLERALLKVEVASTYTPTEAINKAIRRIEDATRSRSIPAMRTARQAIQNAINDLQGKPNV
jgi:hypothetical protein